MWLEAVLSEGMDDDVIAVKKNLLPWCGHLIVPGSQHAARRLRVGQRMLRVSYKMAQGSTYHRRASSRLPEALAGFAATLAALCAVEARRWASSSAQDRRSGGDSDDFASCCDEKHLQADVNTGLRTGDEARAVCGHISAGETTVPAVCFFGDCDRLDRAFKRATPSDGECTRSWRGRGSHCRAWRRCRIACR